MKLLLDFFPLILFFAAFKVAGIYWATGIAIVATVSSTVMPVAAASAVAGHIAGPDEIGAEEGAQEGERVHAHGSARRPHRPRGLGGDGVPRLGGRRRRVGLVEEVCVVEAEEQVRQVAVQPARQAVGPGLVVQAVLGKGRGAVQVPRRLGRER